MFGTSFGIPQNAYATCINTLQAQTIAAAYEGDTEPTVHHIDTCSGDDIGYQIPIATTITFDGVEYSNIYATTNSVITFGQPDGTYWDYPSTPSISLYSMDWFPGYAGRTEGLDIYYSEGGFQINLNMVPFGNWNAEPSTVNILVAITNTGGISVAYSYQGPEYSNMRTGVRLHDGSIVSLEAWGATQIQPGEEMPSLDAEPILSEPELTPEQQQAEVVEATQLATEISDLNNLIASINNEDLLEENIPEPEPTIDPEIPLPPVDEPEPDVVVDPEIITPEDPRFPDDTDEQNEQDPSTNPEDSGTVEEPLENEEPVTEPESPEEGTDQSPIDKPKDPLLSQDPSQNSDNSSSNNGSTGISEEELRKLNSLISENDAKLLAELIGTNETVAQAVQEFTERAKENTDAPMPYTIADAITEVQTEKLLEDPVGTFTSMFTEIDTEVLLSPSEWGKDMTDDQREKVQEIVVSVIIASNLISASINRRIG